MQYKGRALYNLLQMNLKSDPHLDVESWQVEDYRSLSHEELFKRLESHGLFLDTNHMTHYIEECDSPEELTDLLMTEENFVGHEQVFLSLFELWRRLAPFKQTLSIFADELDHLIEEYEAGKMELEEQLQSSLLSFQRILDDHVDEGGGEQEGFELFAPFSCHDLELFIYEYIAHQIDIENDLYASELLEGFYPYLKNRRWFDFLRLRLVISVEAHEAVVMMERLLESLKEKPDLQLLFEMLHFFVYLDKSTPFQSAFTMAIHQIQTEDDLREALSILSDYMNTIDRPEEEAQITQVIQERKARKSDDPIDPEDQVLTLLKSMVVITPAI